MTVSLTGPDAAATLTNLDASEGDLVWFSARLEGTGMVASAGVTPGEELRRFSADVAEFLAT